PFLQTWVRRAKREVSMSLSKWQIGILAPGLIALVTACETPAEPPPAPTAAPAQAGQAQSGPPTEATAPPPPQPPPQEQAHRYLVSIASCWFGGLWSVMNEAETPETRKEATVARCKEVVKSTHGGEDAADLERLRAVDPGEV